MSYYRVCPYCGDYLDPGETCDCTETKAAANVASIDSGMRWKPWPDSTPNNNKNGGKNQHELQSYRESNRVRFGSAGS